MSQLSLKPPFRAFIDKNKRGINEDINSIYEMFPNIGVCKFTFIRSYLMELKEKFENASVTEFLLLLTKKECENHFIKLLNNPQDVFVEPLQK